MNDKVLGNGRRIHEGSVATWLGALVVSNVEMRIDVSLQLAGLRKTFGTVAAFMPTFAGMNQHTTKEFHNQRKLWYAASSNLLHLNTFDQFSTDRAL